MRFRRIRYLTDIVVVYPAEVDFVQNVVTDIDDFVFIDDKIIEFPHTPGQTAFAHFDTQRRVPGDAEEIIVHDIVILNGLAGTEIKRRALGGIPFVVAVVGVGAEFLPVQHGSDPESPFPEIISFTATGPFHGWYRGVGIPVLAEIRDHIPQRADIVHAKILQRAGCRLGQSAPGPSRVRSVECECHRAGDEKQCRCP